MLLPNHNLNEFWDDAISKTEGLKSAALLQRQFSCFAEGERIATDIISTLCQQDQSSPKPAHRVYIDGRPAHDWFFSRNNKPLADESIQDWSERCFGDQSFCIVLTKISDYSEDYTRAVAKLLSPLMPTKLEQLGCPNPFVAAGFFLGNYDKTPFGIHIDDPELKSVLHIHLGPGSKRMTVWPASHPEFSNRKIIHEGIESHLNSGKTYTIEPGDAFFLPAGGCYHIGENQSLSLALTIGINDFRNNLRKIVKESLKHSAGNTKTTSNQDPKNELQQLIDHQAYQRISNEHLPPCITPHKALPPVLRGTIKRVAPFKLQLRTTDQHDAKLIYARGHRLKQMASAASETLIKKINSDFEINIENWLNEQLTPIERTNQAALIRELHAVNAIDMEVKEN